MATLLLYDRATKAPEDGRLAEPGDIGQILDALHAGVRRPINDGFLLLIVEDRTAAQLGALDPHTARRDYRVNVEALPVAVRDRIRADRELTVLWSQIAPYVEAKP